MQDTVQNDRFYEEKEMLEFAPEPMHVFEASHKGKFTVGNKYPVLERKDGNLYGLSGGFGAYFGSTYKFKTTDDKGTEVWVDDKYFIPAEQTLTFDELFQSKNDNPDLLEWDGDFCQPDIRRLATEKGVSSDWNLDDGLVLSGVTDPDEDLDEEDDGYEDDDRPMEKVKKKVFAERTSSWPLHERSSIYDGVVKDNGNEIMFDGRMCQEAIERVFGPKDPEETGDIIGSIREMFKNHHLMWDEGFLAVNNAKTKISYSDVHKAYAGLKALMTPKIAEKVVSKIVAKKLSKVF